IVEIGSHDELMRIQDGRYRMLVEAQNRSTDADIDDVMEDTTGDVPSLDNPRKSSLYQMKRSISNSGVREKMVTETETEGSEAGDSSAPPVSISRLWMLSLPEWKYLVFGGIGAILNASVFPVWGVLLTKMTVLFFEYEKTKHDLLVDARYWSLAFVILGLVFGVSITMQHYGFGVASQKLVSRVRLAAFSAMLHQEIGWFDLDENSSGALVSRLATDSATLQAMTSDMLNQGLVNFTTLGIAFVIAFYYSWQMTLALLATSPILVFASIIQNQQMSGAVSNKKNNDADTAAGSILSEAIGSIRTVASFSMEKALNTVYVGYLDESKQADSKVGIVGGAAFGFSQGVMFIAMAFLFWLGGLWVSKGIITFQDMFMVIMVIMLSTFAVGMAAQNMTDSAKAKKA
ncbi:Multidrug resistance protein abc superfamily, partial [Globisporangium polare]